MIGSHKHLDKLLLPFGLLLFHHLLFPGWGTWMDGWWGAWWDGWMESFISSRRPLIYKISLNPVPNAQVCVFDNTYYKITTTNYISKTSPYTTLLGSFWGEFIFIVSTWNLFFLHILAFFVKRNGPNRQI